MSNPRPTAFFFLAATLLMATGQAKASDIKSVSPVVCQVYGKPLDPSQVQIRPDGIFNISKTIQTLLCPLPKDTEQGWGIFDWEVTAFFAQQGALSAPLTDNACTLYVGTKRHNTYMGKTKHVASTPMEGAIVRFDEKDALSVTWAEPATLVCNIAPGNILEWITLTEGDL